MESSDLHNPSADNFFPAQLPHHESLITNLWNRYRLDASFAKYQDVLHGYLKDWNVEHPLLESLPLFPWIRHYSLEIFHEFEGLISADQYQQLSRFWEIQQVRDMKSSGRAYANKSRQLMRLAYLDSNFVLISIAEHLAYSEISGQREILEETSNVYLNLLKMFGFWRIRREQIEKISENLDRYEHVRIKNEIANRQLNYDKAKANFERLITHLCKVGDISLTEINFRTPRPGRVLQKTKEKRMTSSEQLRSSAVDLITQKAVDCYKLLYSVHRIGVPIRGSFIDYISKPQFNGYSGLHTKIFFKDQSITLTLDIRIKTEQMEQLNLNGFIVSKNEPHSLKTTSGKRWWDILKENDELIQAIRENDIRETDEESRDIYVFSPSGEAHLIPKKFRAIDFAYHLHTEVGHHAESILINGLPAQYDAELRNGDLIKINYDPLFPGPLPEWMLIAQGSKTRREIRANLFGLSTNQTESYKRLHRYLEGLKDESGFVMPAALLERHLLTIADQLGYDHVGGMFIAIDRKINPKKRKKITVNWLLARVLELEYTRHLQFIDGSPVRADGPTDRAKSPQIHIRFCQTCKPVPPNEVALQIKNHGQNRKEYVLHRTEPIKGRFFGLPSTASKTCFNKFEVNEKNKILDDIKWGDIVTKRKLFQLTVIARDGSALIQTVCQPIWERDRVMLSGINATADTDGSAYISLVIECDLKEQAVEVSREIQSLPAVTTATLSPVATETSLTFQRQYGNLKNPYSTGAPVDNVSHFFGRDPEKNQFKNYLAADESKRLIVIHGHRRSGKTSFANHVKYHLLRGSSNIVVFADLQLFTSFESNTFYSELAYEIWLELQDLKIDVDEPTPKQFESNGYRAFERFMMQTQAVTDRKIIVLADEFNLLAEELARETTAERSLLFDQLRGITMSQRFKSLLLVPIIHTSIYKLGLANEKAQEFYAQARLIEILPLNNEAATDLITKPMDSFIKFDQGVINRLIAGTAGNPYLINLLCYEMVELLFDDERSIAYTEDLEAAYSQSLMNNATTYFNFIIRHIAEIPFAWRTVLHIAQYQDGQLGWVDIQHITHPNREMFTSPLEHLINTNVLEEKNNQQSLRISCGYFREWVYQKPSQFEEAVKFINDEN